MTPFAHARPVSLGVRKQQQQTNNKQKKAIFDGNAAHSVMDDCFETSKWEDVEVVDRLTKILVNLTRSQPHAHAHAQVSLPPCGTH